jgi:nucleoside-diphosphate-sugar epimerase
MDENPAYEKTNVTGTRYVLNMSQLLKIKHFMFSSSLAACKFPSYEKALTEDSLPDAEFPYARSKKKGEAVIRDYAGGFSCSVVRLAAVYSDWCEYPPLYMLLKTWLSKNNLMSSALGGRGESAVPYIHVKDLIKIFLRIIEINDSLPEFGIYCASPPGSVSHKDLFQMATKYYYGRDITPILIPKPVAAFGLVFRSFFGRFVGREPFEQPWMVKYIDKKLNIDPTATYKALNWKPTPRYHILRRLLFLTEKMINSPTNWMFRNEALLKRIAVRKSTTIYDVLVEKRKVLIDKILEQILSPENASRFQNYRNMDHDLLKWYVSLGYQLISTTVRDRDRKLMQEYAQIIVLRRYAEGFKTKEMKSFLYMLRDTISDTLKTSPELKGMEHRINDYIHLTIQFTIDEIEDTYEFLESQPSEYIQEIAKNGSPTSSDDLKRIVRKIEDICSDSIGNRLSSEFLNLRR